MSSLYDIEDSPQITVIVDMDTNTVVDANSRAYGFWGMPDKPSFLGTRLSRLFQTDETSSLTMREPVFTSLFLPDGMHQRAVLFLKPIGETGSLCWVDILPLEELTVRDFSKTYGMFSTLQRQLAEEKEANRLFENAPVGLMQLGEGMRAMRANRRLFELFDRTYEDANGQFFCELFRCRARSGGRENESCSRCELKNLLESVLKTKEPLYHFETEMTVEQDGKDARKRFKASITPHQADDARYVIVSLDEITGGDDDGMEYERLSKTDDLSGIPNRRAAMEFFRKSLQEVIAHDSVLCLAMIDLDGFKEINDKYSHGFGDEVIRASSEFVAGKIRAIDFLARYGGDEFVVVFPNTNAVQARRIIERIRRDLRATRIGGADINLTFSTGILEIDARMARAYSTDALIHSADVLLYKAKAGEKNRIITEKL